MTTEATMEYHPRIVSWNVTTGCHLRCPHCYLDARRPQPDEIRTGEGLRLIDELADAGTEMLILTGGEPLLRRDLFALADHASARNIHVVLGTTGMLITLEIAKRLRAAGVAAAGISIDSVDPAKHDAFRGVQGAWRGAVRGMEACREAGLEVVIHTTALKMNQAEIPDIMRFADQNGARAFHLFFLVCTGRGEGLTDLSPQEYETLLGVVLDAQERHGGMMVRARCAPYVARLAMERDMSPHGIAGCMAATSYCRITPTGEVTPCPYLPVVAGNVRDTPFAQVWGSSPVLAQLRKPQLRLEGKCGECPLSRGDTPLCGGCRARVYARTGSLTAEDVWCERQPQPVGAHSLGNGMVIEESPDPLPTGQVEWTAEAQERLERIPFFIRGRVKQAAEGVARREGLAHIGTEVLERLRERAYGGRRSR